MNVFLMNEIQSDYVSFSSSRAADVGRLIAIRYHTYILAVQRIRCLLPSIMSVSTAWYQFLQEHTYYHERTTHRQETDDCIFNIPT